MSHIRIVHATSCKKHRRPSRPILNAALNITNYSACKSLFKKQQDPAAAAVIRNVLTKWIPCKICRSRPRRIPEYGSAINRVESGYHVPAITKKESTRAVSAYCNGMDWGWDGEWFKYTHAHTHNHIRESSVNCSSAVCIQNNVFYRKPIDLSQLLVLRQEEEVSHACRIASPLGLQSSYVYSHTSTVECITDFCWQVDQDKRIQRVPIQNSLEQCQCHFSGSIHIGTILGFVFFFLYSGFAVELAPVLGL
jgi:hypothetical protein